MRGRLDGVAREAHGSVRRKFMGACADVFLGGIIRRTRDSSCDSAANYRAHFIRGRINCGGRFQRGALVGCVIPRHCNLRGGDGTGAFDNISADYFLDGWTFRRGNKTAQQRDVCIGECGRSDLACGCGIHVNAHREFEGGIVGAVCELRGDVGIFGDDEERTN